MRLLANRISLPLELAAWAKAPGSRILNERKNLPPLHVPSLHKGTHAISAYFCARHQKITQSGILLGKTTILLKIVPRASRSLENDGGESGIRTHGGEAPNNGFRDRRLRPLSHLSAKIRKADNAAIPPLARRLTCTGRLPSGNPRISRRSTFPCPARPRAWRRDGRCTRSSS